MNQTIRLPFALLFVCLMAFSYCGVAQFDTSGLDASQLNTSDLVNDINQELNVHRPHGEYRHYVIAGVFRELPNAKGFMKKYRAASGNEVYVFKEPEGMYYVAVEGPLLLEEAKQLVERLNTTSDTQPLSNGKVWIFSK